MVADAHTCGANQAHPAASAPNTVRRHALQSRQDDIGPRQAIFRPVRSWFAVVLVASALGGGATSTAGYGVAATPYRRAEVGPGYDDSNNNGFRYDTEFESG